MAKKKKKSERKIVGHPLTPGLLKELNAFNVFPPVSTGFKPKGSWENKYLIWTCHGYMKANNENNGLLRIMKTAGDSPGSFSLKIKQKVVHDEGSVHRTDVELKCKNDALASPIEWELSSRFLRPDNKERAELDVVEEGVINKDTLEIISNGHSFKRKNAGNLTSDFSLFEAVQRRAFTKEKPDKFNVLEGMSLLKKNHYLVYRGLETFEINNKKISLHHFHQIGHGVLPYDYWLDSDHRLIIAATGARAYILDEKANEKVKEYERSWRKSYENTRKKYNEKK